MKGNDAPQDSNELMTEGKTVESHPFGPVLPSNATIMMMGTFPPTEDILLELYKSNGSPVRI